MLAVNNYPKEYVAECRRRIDAEIAAYEKLAKASKGAAAKALEEFEAVFFNNMVLALDHYFLHRARGGEGKDGNPVNEVRVICDSLTDNGGVMTPNKTIKMKPEDSLLHLEEEDEIKLTEGDFRQLSTAFLVEIERRFPPA